ncbi:MAG: hypothetical protein ACOY6K_14855 [Pseudomonadota bacterium]
MTPTPAGDRPSGKFCGRCVGPEPAGAAARGRFARIGAPMPVGCPEWTVA